MELGEEVDRHLMRTGMSATRFGRLVARDPSLVSDLRRGRRPTTRLRARILAQIGRREDMAEQFAAALDRLAQRRGYGLASAQGSPWASAGFVGEQAICRLVAGPGADPAWPACLPDHGWRLPFLVADLEVAPSERGVGVTALLLPEL